VEQFEPEARRIAVAEDQIEPVMEQLGVEES
jgi:hypothetical protein